MVGVAAVLATIVTLAVVSRAEEQRLVRERHAWQARQVELGAQLFDQHCAVCHGRNAVGGLGPPLDASSGLHGGALGPGIAWRLEELGWDRAAAYEFIYHVTAGGVPISTRPDRYPGNRPRLDPQATGAEGAAGPSTAAMAMPAWSREYGGPLLPYQVAALTRYVVAFGDAVPTPTAAVQPGPVAAPPRR